MTTNTNIENKELEIAAEQAENPKALFEYTLSRPIVYNGVEYNTLSFDFDKLTGAAALNIEAELSALGKPAIVPSFSGEYLIRMAAKACTAPIGAEFFNIIPIADYNKIISVARNFLMRTEVYMPNTL